jgi:hypothetical protein
MAHMTTAPMAKRVKIPALLTLLLLLCAGFAYVSMQSFAPPSEPMNQELPRALFLPDAD